MNFTTIRENKVGNLRVRVFAKVTPAIAKLELVCSCFSYPISCPVNPIPNQPEKFKTAKGSLKKKKDKLGLLAQPRGGTGRKAIGVPNPLNRFLKIC